MTTRKTATVAGTALLASLFSLNASAAWDGLYIGASFAWVDADEDWTSDENDDPVSASDSGSALGILWGYNFQKDQLVIGVEADIAATSADPGVSDWGSADFIGTDLEAVARLRTRVGFVIAQDFLPFVSLGVALAQTETSIDSERFDSVRTGLSYGFGVEWAASDSLRARFEVSRDEYSSEGFGSYNALGDSAFGSLDTENVSLGFIYAF